MARNESIASGTPEYRHSPGPFSVQTAPNGRATAVTITSASGRIVGFAHILPHPAADYEWQGNANLFAASAELLAACQLRQELQSDGADEFCRKHRLNWRIEAPFEIDGDEMEAQDLVANNYCDAAEYAAISKATGAAGAMLPEESSGGAPLLTVPRETAPVSPADPITSGEISDPFIRGRFTPRRIPAGDDLNHGHLLDITEPDPRARTSGGAR